MKQKCLVGMLAVLLIGLLGTAIQAQETAIEDDGDFLLIFEDVEDENGQAVRQFLLEEGRFDELLAILNEIVLPTDITIHFRSGEPGEAYYNPAEHEVVLSYEFAALIFEVFADAPYDIYLDSPENVAAATIDTLEYVLFHEVGHALVHVLDIPITGREEDAVDALSAVMLVEVLEEPDILTSAADFYDLISMSKQEISDEELWNEHALDEQRYYNLVCWCYGNDPEEFEQVLVDSGMGKDRAERCEEEYAQIMKSWSTLLAPYIKE
ncbi:hypothetical protein U27_01024 [Candidatus Vecturithrix granuli]|uniref:Uncharacterized protein n=1 Tax=Vecturithrix granuli TaxID=1499967 RepID=A0A081C971_VECG1|nr:hypothetical protein U27_01024 [Candidatus Vecturithrix granuli]